MGNIFDEDSCGLCASGGSKQGAHLIKVPKAAKILDEPIAFFEQAVYNTCNKSAANGKNIRRRVPWRSKETCI